MKRKGHLAVFENVSEDSDTKSVQNDDSDELFIDEEIVKPKIRKKVTKLSAETNIMVCKFQACNEKFEDYFKYNRHLVQHIKDRDSCYEEAHFTCEFGDCCDFRPLNLLHAIQHISFHGYQEKLKNLGEIVARRDSLPDCKMENSFNCPMTIETYKCEWEDCDMNMETHCDFLIHVKMHVNGYSRTGKDTNNKCEWKGCGKKFSVLSYLKKHIPVHTKEKYIACPTCSTTFCSLAKYSDHRSKQIPIEKQNYKCSQCSKLFATESLLRDHVRSHINQYKCSMCDMTCPKPANLAIHMRFRHLNIRPFKCNLCDHSSYSKQNLEMHLITHCAEKLLACDECDFKCRSMYGLDKHLQKKHGQSCAQIFECHICKKRYERGAALSIHLMKKHGVQWPSGHSRFRYKEDPDGICRLQTIRYETVDVIKEILKSKTDIPSNTPKKVKCMLVKKELNGSTCFEANIEEIPEPNVELENSVCEKKDVLITISDIDNQGNVLSEITESQKIICGEELDVSNVEFV